MGSIIVRSGSQKGDFYPLGRRTSVIGRDEGLLIQILDEHVSRKHMKIRFDKEKKLYYALDMNSRQGVFINGERIGEETALADGDEVHQPGVPPHPRYEPHQGDHRRRRPQDVTDRRQPRRRRPATG